MKIESDKELRKLVILGLKTARSPDEIAGRMKEEKRKKRVGTNAIYKWVYSPFGQRYRRYLCTKRKQKKKQQKKWTERHLKMLRTLTRLSDK